MALQVPVYLGQTKLPASSVGIGTWAIGGGWGPQPEEQSLEAIVKALESGCSLIDTAAMYGNGRAESLIARACKAYGSRVTICTKVSPLHYHWAPAPGTPIEHIYPSEHIIAQAESSLRRLETDCLDCLLFQTWCPSWGEERAWYETMRLLQKQGKIRAFGISVSDHRADEANEVIKAGLIDILEVPYSVLDQRAARVLFPLAQQHHVSIIARTPLASGALAEGWHEGMTFPRTDWRRRVFRGDVFLQTIQRVERWRSVVEQDLPLAQMALRFCLSHPAVSATIPGVRSAEHATCNLAVMQQEPLPLYLIKIMETLWDEEFQYHVRTSIGEEGKG